jgi:hypothetical protein
MSKKNDLDIEEIIAGMKHELHKLHAERSAIDRQMDTIKKALVGLATLYGEEAISIDFLKSVHAAGYSRASLTEACCSIMRHSDLPLGTGEIYRRIVLQDPDMLNDHKHPATSVAMALRRLLKKGQLRQVRNGRGKMEWAWADSCLERTAPPAHEQTRVAAASATGGLLSPTADT